MTKKLQVLSVALIVLFILLAFSTYKNSKAKNINPENSIFSYPFNYDGLLYEAGSLDESPSQYWWVNSGALLRIENGVGETNIGPLAQNDKWRIMYRKDNPRDTDNGYYPQNIFRLVSKGQWESFSEQAYFQIVKNNLSQSENRNESNGLLLFLRYMDENNLYYAGVRVDGEAVIKKKINGKYYILGEVQIIPGDLYDRKNNPSLLPLNTWIGIKSEISDVSKDETRVKLYTDIGRTGNWTLALDVIDNSLGGKNLKGKGYTGIRTDFMDVKFDDFEVDPSI